MKDSKALRPIITGEKVLLRPIQMEDTELIVKWRNTESVKKNFIFRQPFTNTMHEKWMHTKVATGEVVQYIICKKESKKPIGSVYFRDIDMKNRSAEFGIFIGDANERGGGLGTETTKLFVQFGFATLNLHRIFLRVLKGNDSAVRAYKKAGFNVEGCFKDMVFLEHCFVDVIFMSTVSKKI